MMRWVIGSIAHGRPTKLFLVPASAPLGESSGSTLGESSGSTLGESSGSTLGESSGSTLGESSGSTLGESGGISINRRSIWACNHLKVELSLGFTLTIAAQNALGIKFSNGFYMNFIDSYVISKIKWTAICLKF